MTRVHDPLRVYLIMEAGLAFAFALAFTLQGVYFVQTVGLSPLDLLLIGAALEGSAFVLEVPTGVLADAYSRRLSLVVGCALLGVGMLLVGSFPVFGVLLAAQVVSAAGYTCLSGAQEAWLADELGEERLGSALLLGGQYGRVAGVVGVLGAAGLARWGGPAAAILAGGGAALLVGAYLALRMPERGFRPAPRAQRHTWAALRAPLVAGVQAVRGSALLTALIVAAALYGASTEAIDRLHEFLLIRETGLPGGLSAADWFVALGVVGALLGWALIEPLRRRLDLADARQVARTLRAVLAGSVAALLAFALAPGFGWAVGALLVHGVLRGLYSPLYSAWLNHGLAPGSRATVNSFAAQADALGQVSFGPLFGLAGNVWGVRAALVLAALVRVPTLGVIARAGQADDPAAGPGRAA
ncbi:MFS family permease [Deinococcus metalli]|uniref:MFS family permease n=1 Tax=Deinococcus metalli TaxID=1141878 RepID=A0A7W8KKS3_9DEIO|nr:MFS transporter [Deinococcus metalli]MBB5378344.1 MFS family permease [Deinococcus metalli]GHF59563.1 MFS transporter [Deinococcus metalli]